MSVPPHVRAAFARQGQACAGLGSPFMGRLMPLIGARLDRGTEVGARLLDWPGDISPNGHSVPLRLAGALHGLVLDGADAALAAAYPPHAVDDETLWHAVRGAFVRHRARLMDWLDQAPQTNEVRRAGVVLPALWHLLDRVGPRPLVLSELGASAGLNLRMDRFALATPGGTGGPADSPVALAPDWRGAPPPAPRRIAVANRAGVDLNPIDAGSAAGALRLAAYLWPEQPERLARTRDAIALGGPAPDRGDAAPWLARRLETAHPGCLHVVYTTIAWQYFPPETQAACTAALAAAGARATAAAPLAHVAFEADGDPGGAALRVRLWPGPAQPEMVARADFHGRWVDWRG